LAQVIPTLLEIVVFKARGSGFLKLFLKFALASLKDLPAVL